MGVMGIDQKPWSYAHNALLRELWETTPSSKIAALVGRSRNAVIGRAHRLKLPPKRFLTGNKTKSAPKRGVSQKLDTPRVTNQRPAPLSDKSAGAIPTSPRQYADIGLALAGSVREEENAAQIQFGAPHPAPSAGEGSPNKPQPSPVALPVPLLELTARSCRYIVDGEGEHALFCNAERKEHGPYCESHAARCFTVPERRKAA